MGVKKLRSIFMRYIFAVAGGILLIIAINLGLYSLCVNTGVIIPAMQIEDGIGLYVANSIVTQHGGQLILSNSEKTGGAQVTISIPY